MRNHLLDHKFVDYCQTHLIDKTAYNICATYIIVDNIRINA
jgi:hypothetical protein